MRIGRRPVFFAVVGLVCLVLLPVTPAEFRWLNVAMAALAFFWTVMLAIEDLSHTHRDEQSGGSP
jgi:hypothetical protein